MNKANKKKSKVVVVGGGTGSFVVLSGLRNYNLDLTAVVSVTDSGGSTGRLRTEFGFLPVGDMRQCLAALALNGKDNYIRRLLLYRFDKGRGLKGHNLGNLILTSLTDLTGSEPKAIEIAANIFRLKGKTLPITSKNIQLAAFYEDGSKVIGEHEIDEPKHQGAKKIIKLTTKPKAFIYSEAKKAILEADLIILGPGDLYTSILPNLIIGGVKKTFLQTKARIVYIVNLMTRYSQTHLFSSQDHLNEIEKYLGRKVDYVLINNGKIPASILRLYKKEKGYPVLNDLVKKPSFKIIKENFLAPKMVIKQKEDILKRSYLRHDSNKLAKTIASLLR